MNETLNNIKTRRSIRRFKPDPVPQEILDQIIEAGLYAPSSMGKQNTIILQITDSDLRDEISRMNCEIGGWEKALIHFTMRLPYWLCLQKKTGETECMTEVW